MKSRNLGVELHYGWEMTDYEFPGSFKGHNHPAIYTWVLTSTNGDKSYYLGETVNLSRRIYHYMNPGPTQATNIRIKEEMDNSKEVHLYVLNIESFILNGNILSEDALKDKYTRRGLEGILIRELRLRKQGHIIHNR